VHHFDNKLIFPTCSVRAVPSAAMQRFIAHVLTWNALAAMRKHEANKFQVGMLNICWTTPTPGRFQETEYTKIADDSEILWWNQCIRLEKKSYDFHHHSGWRASIIQHVVQHAVGRILALSPSRFFFAMSVIRPSNQLGCFSLAFNEHLAELWFKNMITYEFNTYSQSEFHQPG
jgi:hypothetical protein